MTLEEFLTARIDEDEAAMDCPIPEAMTEVPSEYPWTTDPAFHLQRFGPEKGERRWSMSRTRMASEIEAKRQIVASVSDPSRPHRVPLPWPNGEAVAWNEVVAWKCRACDQWCDDSPRDGSCPVDWREPPAVLRLLALPYSDHPDYDRGWAL